MIKDFSSEPSLIADYVRELRDLSVQSDRMRFRLNMQRIGSLIGYEISKQLPYREVKVETPLGHAVSRELAEQPVLATILRAGMVLHQGLLDVFDKADNAFVSAYRKHDKDGSFVIKRGYMTTPDLNGRILILSDPMLATGSSMVLTLEELSSIGTPKEIHLVTAIACSEGIERVNKAFPDLKIWAAAIDPELNDKAYIVPGLGDAGDLAYGEKIQA